MVPDNYNDELLEMAHDLAARLLPAFEKTATGIPYPRVQTRAWCWRSALALESSVFG